MVDEWRRGKDDRIQNTLAILNGHVEGGHVYRVFLETRLEKVGTIYSKKTWGRKGWAQRVLNDL